MKTIISSALALVISGLSSNTAQAQNLEDMARKIIESQGLWCQRVSDISPMLTGNSANKKFYRVFCESFDKEENATYTIEVGRGGQYVKVREI